MSSRARAVVVGLVALLAWPGVRRADARPTYFEVFTSRYGLTAADRTYACGNCHYKWTGTGARNLFGTAVEQQLYVGKSIDQSLQDIEGDDTDGDGFTNLDEIVTFKTLPGYSCSNFYQAIDAPLDYHTFITPMVSTCLEPLDIRLSLDQIAFITKVGMSQTVPLTVFNNGSDTPLTISSYGLLAGTNAAFSLSGPAAPFDIPVGQSVVLDLVFTPPSAVFATGTLRVTSNDPDEGTIDVPLQGFGFVQVLAPADVRARCLKSVDKQFRRYTARHLREWGRCYRDEVNGLACDTGSRDLKIAQAEARLRDTIGGSKDTTCAPNGVTATSLGFPATCGAPCGAITLNSLTSLVNCLVCSEDAGRDTTLRAVIGTAPPDLPPNTAGTSGASQCEKRLVGGLEKGIANVQKILGRCELDNVTAAVPADCSAGLASDLAAVQAKVGAQVGHCTDTTGLLGCLFEPVPDPACLGTTALTVGSDLVSATFGVTP